MNLLAFPEPLFTDLQTQLLADTRETAAVFFTELSRHNRRVVRAGELAPEGAYQIRNEIAAELSPTYIVDVANRARSAGSGLVFAHTHPFALNTPEFSAADDAGEDALLAFLNERVPGAEHIALVLGPDGARARRLGGGSPVAIDLVGKTLARLPGAPGDDNAVSEIYDRQVRAFGAAGQRRLRGLTVAVIGLGGTGSVVVQELALLGISHFLLIDPDRLENTNRNRVLGATDGDIGSLKVDIAARSIRTINREATITALQGDVLNLSIAKRLPETDILFICTDSHASRAAVAEIAYQHLLPTFDMGVAITVEEGHVRHITGRVQMLAPGLPCLLCSGALDSNAIRCELMPDAHRRADPYFEGEGEPQPAVVSLNATISSLAVSMFLAAVTGLPLAARHQWYDGIKGIARSLSAAPVSNCLVCSPSGALGKGSRRTPLHRTDTP